MKENVKLIFSAQKDSPGSTKAATVLNKGLVIAAASEHGVHAEVIELTVPMAKLLLDHNPKNRSLTAGPVSSIIADIVADRFELNGESVVLSGDGNLVDGQYRAAAVVEADRSIITVMVYGPLYAARMTTDQGKNRTTSDYLRMDGHAYYKEQGAAAALLWLYERYGNFKHGGPSVRPSRTTLFQYVKDHPEVAWAAGLMHGHSSALCPLPKSLLVAVAAILSHIDLDSTKLFIERFISQAGLDAGDPAYVLHRLLAARRAHKIPTPTPDQGELLMRAWNAYREGRSVKTFRVLGKMPKPI